LVGGGMDAVLGDLAQLGYDAEWESIPAAAVGAPHLRYRVWIVAYATGSDAGRWTGQQQGAEPPDGLTAQLLSDASRGGGAAAAGDHYETVADADDGRCGQLDAGLGRLPVANTGSQNVADPERSGRRRGPSHEGREQERRAAAGWSGTGGGWSNHWLTEPDVGRVAHGVPARVDRLRSLGNAVVPQVVEVIGRRLMAAHLEAAA